MDSEVVAVLKKRRLKRLEQQIQDMLADKSLDYRHIVRELDNECRHTSSPDKLVIVRILYDIRKAGLTYHDGMKKLQKVLCYYAIEHENVLALKP